MKYIIYGAGAVGSLVGAHLARAGSDVALLGRPAHVAAIRAHGVRLKTMSGTEEIRLFAADDLRDITFAPGDVTLLCVKTQDTGQACAALARRVDLETPIFCLQNGVRGEEIAAHTFRNVYGVVLSLGVRLVGPGEIVNYTGHNLLTIGRYPDGLDDIAETVGQAMATAGFKVSLSPDVMAVKWSKLVINLSNSIYAITGLSITELRNSPEGRAFMADVWEEGLNALQAAGIHPEPIPGRENMREETRQLREPVTPQPLPEDVDLNYYPSTWQDLVLQRGDTESSYLNGEIVTLGERYGVPTPLNRLLWEVVEDMARKGEQPGKYALAELREIAGRTLSGVTDISPAGEVNPE
jgi:2-dehydropantoate 2-reductase